MAANAQNFKKRTTQELADDVVAQFERLQVVQRKNEIGDGVGGNERFRARRLKNDARGLPVANDIKFRGVCRGTERNASAGDDQAVKEKGEFRIATKGASDVR